MKGIVTIFLKLENNNEVELLAQKQKFESINRELFSKLRAIGYEIMYAPVPNEAGSHISLNCFEEV